MILTLKELADHLKVNDRTILRMLKSGQIQGVKIGGQWRFNGSQIDHLFFPSEETQNKISKTEEGAVPLHELTNSSFVPISRLFNEKRFFFDLQGTNMEEIITELTDRKIFNTLVLDIPDLRAKCMARENLLCTAVGNGIAVPHPRDPITTLKAPGVIIFGRSQKGLALKSPDGKPVHLFFLICSQNIDLHLHLMGKLAEFLKNQKFVECCLKSNSPVEIIQEIMKVEREEFLKARE